MTPDIGRSVKSDLTPEWVEPLTDEQIVQAFGVHPDFVVECVESVPQSREES